MLLVKINPKFNMSQSTKFQQSKKFQKSKSESTTKWGSNNERRTGHVQVHSKWVGKIIGHGGQTIKGIAKDAGHGCHVNHSRDPLLAGRFEITAWHSNAVECAKHSILKIVAQQEGDSRPKTKPKTKPTKEISVLYQSDSDEEEDEEPLLVKKPTSKKERPRDISHLMGFTQSGSDIASLKKKGWQRSTAYKAMMGSIGTEWDNMSSAQRQSTGGWVNFKYAKVGVFNTQHDITKTTVDTHTTELARKEVVMDVSDFPQCGGGEGSISAIGSWGNTLELKGVMDAEPVIKKPITPAPSLIMLTKTPTMTTLTPTKVPVQVTPVYTEDAWSDDEDTLPKTSQRSRVTIPTHLRPTLTRQYSEIQLDDPVDDWDTAEFA